MKCYQLSVARNAWTRKLILPVTYTTTTVTTVNYRLAMYHARLFKIRTKADIVPPRRSITPIVGLCERQKWASSCHTSHQSLYLSHSFDRHRRQYKTALLALFAGALWAYKVRGHICPPLECYFKVQSYYIYHEWAAINFLWPSKFYQSCTKSNSHLASSIDASSSWIFTRSL